MNTGEPASTPHAIPLALDLLHVLFEDNPYDDDDDEVEGDATATLPLVPASVSVAQLLLNVQAATTAELGTATFEITDLTSKLNLAKRAGLALEALQEAVEASFRRSRLKNRHLTVLQLPSYLLKAAMFRSCLQAFATASAWHDLLPVLQQPYPDAALKDVVRDFVSTLKLPAPPTNRMPASLTCACGICQQLNSFLSSERTSLLLEGKAYRRGDHGEAALLALCRLSDLDLEDRARTCKVNRKLKLYKTTYHFPGTVETLKALHSMQAAQQQLPQQQAPLLQQQTPLLQQSSLLQQQAPLLQQASLLQQAPLLQQQLAVGPCTAQRVFTTVSTSAKRPANATTASQPPKVTKTASQPPKATKSSTRPVPMFGSTATVSTAAASLPPQATNFVPLFGTKPPVVDDDDDMDIIVLDSD